MAYPINPTNGQQTNVNGLIYTYSTAIGAWTVASGGGSLTVSTDISATGTITSVDDITTGGELVGATLSTTGNITVAGINATDVTFSGSASVVGSIQADGDITAGGIINTAVIPRVTTIATASVITADVETTDQTYVTNLASAVTIAEPTGTPSEGQRLTYRILDNGSAQSIAWDPIFVAVGTNLPITTVPGKYVYVGCYYNSEEASWDVVAVAQQS